MEALDKVLYNVKLKENVKDHMLYTLEEYKNYLESLKEIEKNDPQLAKSFFRLLKINELKASQQMESEDSFLIDIGLGPILDGSEKSSIDIVTKYILKDKGLNNERLEKIHRIILRGTSDDKEKNYKIRTSKEDTYISEISNGIERTLYVAPKSEEVNSYLNYLYVFLDNNSNNELDVFLTPYLAHFYISALQPFNNGNTRLARLIQYGDIFKVSRKLLDYNLKQPALFLSKNYQLNCGNYRKMIADIVLDPSDENFNKWVNYNLNMTDEQLFCLSNDIEKIKRLR
mgnify:FL=1